MKPSMPLANGAQFCVFFADGFKTEVTVRDGTLYTPQGHKVLRSEVASWLPTESTTPSITIGVLKHTLQELRAAGGELAPLRDECESGKERIRNLLDERDKMRETLDGIGRYCTDTLSGPDGTPEPSMEEWLRQGYRELRRRAKEGLGGTWATTPLQENHHD